MKMYNQPNDIDKKKRGSWRKERKREKKAKRKKEKARINFSLVNWVLDTLKGTRKKKWELSAEL